MRDQVGKKSKIKWAKGVKTTLGTNTSSPAVREALNSAWAESDGNVEELQMDTAWGHAG